MTKKQGNNNPITISESNNKKNKDGVRYNKYVLFMARTSLLLALAVLLHPLHGLLSYPLGPFLKFDLDLSIPILALFLTNFWGGLIIAMAKEWLGGAIFGIGSDFPVGLTAAFIASTLFYLIFAGTHFLFKKVFSKVKINKIELKDFIVFLITLIISCISISIIMTLLNVLFILQWYADLYHIPLDKMLKELKIDSTPKLWALFMSFNIIDYTMAGIIGAFIYRVLKFIE